LEQFLEPRQILAGEAGGVGVEQSGHGSGGGAVEERFHQMAHGAAHGELGLFHRGVDVAEILGTVADMAFLLEGAQMGADGGVAWGIGELGANLGGGGIGAAEEDVHDLPFAAGELRRGRGHGVLPF